MSPGSIPIVFIAIVSLSSLQSKLAPCPAVSAMELFYLSGRQVWVCPPSAWHWAESSSPFRSSRVWQHCTSLICVVAFQTCLTTLPSKSVRDVSHSDKDTNSVATLDSVFASKRKWYASSFLALAGS